MKVALIGVGRWGQVLLKELRQQAEVKYECDSKTDLGPVFSDAEVVAVLIATPTATHLQIAQQALLAGKHVFLEKPGTTNSGDFERLAKLAEEKGLKLAVGYEFPHSTACQKLKELLKGESVKNFFFEWHKWGTFLDDPIAHLLSHDISIALFLGLELKPVAVKRVPVISEADILGVAFENGASAMINRASPLKRKAFTVITERGGYVWENNELFEIKKKNKELKKIDLEPSTSVAHEIKDFLGSISENREPLCNGEFALRVHKIIESVRA